MPDSLRTALRQFQSMDRNGDRILTGAELIEHSAIVRANNELMVNGKAPIPLREGRSTELNPVLRVLHSRVAGVVMASGPDRAASVTEQGAEANTIERDLTDLLSGLSRRDPEAAKALAGVIGDRMRELGDSENDITRAKRAIERAIVSGAVNAELSRLPVIATNISPSELKRAVEIHPDYHAPAPGNEFGAEILRQPYRGNPPGRPSGGRERT